MRMNSIRIQKPKTEKPPNSCSPPPPAPVFSADHPWAASESLRISLSTQGKREQASEFKEPPGSRGSSNES